MSEENSNMLLGVRDKPPALNWILLAIQHVCAMFGATILVPIVVNTTAGADVLSIPVALVSSGLGTLIYLICTRGRSPVLSWKFVCVYCSYGCRLCNRR